MEKMEVKYERRIEGKKQKRRDSPLKKDGKKNERTTEGKQDAGNEPSNEAR